MTDAIRRRSMFYVVHLATMIKVDVYATSGPFDREAMARARPDRFSLTGVLRVRAGQLDLEHMRRWAAALGVADLLERALTEAAE